jgi:inner membrane protein
MDTVTQGLLGAVCGQAACGRRLGHAALAWGAVGGILPDTDMVLSLADPLAEWQYHRSLTHSLWFGPVVGPLLGLAVWRARRRRGALGETPASWIAVFALALLTHPLLDLFTTYGTQLLWPFSRRRFALDAVAIIDIAYTAMLAAALLVAVLRPCGRASQPAALAALGLSTAYLFHGLDLNRRAEAEASRQLGAEGVVASDVHAYPTLLQPWLRRVVARAGDEVRVGLLSTWTPAPVAWARERQEPHPAIDAARATPAGRVFEWFAMGQTAARVRPLGDDAGARGGPVEVEIDDLRYGYGERPGESLWGIRVVADAGGVLQGPPQRFNRRPPGWAGTLARLWRATFRPGAASQVSTWL